MNYIVEQDAWEIDPVTASVRPVDSMVDPVVVVVEEMPSLAITIAEICDFLRIRIEHVTSAHELADALRETAPIAVLSEAAQVDCAVYDLMMAVADYDPGLPVLMVITDQPTARGAVDAAQKLWQLTEIVRIGQRPGIRGLIDFLFNAGRRAGTGRLIPM